MLKRAVHPGLVLKEELAEIGITPTEFARQIAVPTNRVSQIINGKRAITGDTALRFGHWFGVEPEFWLNLQTHFDLVRADGESGKAVRLLPTRIDLPSVHALREGRPPTAGCWIENEMPVKGEIEPALTQMQPIASTHVDAHNSEFTVGALQGMADQINNDVRKPTMWVNHDRTVPPIGVTVAGHVEPIDDGYHWLLAEYDLFPEPTAVGLPTGETGYRQFSEKARHPFKNAEFNEGEEITIGVDPGNLESPDDINEFFHDVRSEQFIEFETSVHVRRALENDPELLITLSLKAAAIWLGSTFLTQAAKTAGDVFSGELRNIYSLLRSAILKYTSYAHPKNRPITYVLQVPGTPNLEFVARSSDPHKVMLAFTGGSHVECRDVVQSFLQRFDTAEFIQFLLSDDGEWRFNYLLTRDGVSIGSRQAYSRRAILLKQLGASAGGQSVSGKRTFRQSLDDP